MRSGGVLRSGGGGNRECFCLGKGDKGTGGLEKDWVLKCMILRCNEIYLARSVFYLLVWRVKIYFTQKSFGGVVASNGEFRSHFKLFLKVLHAMYLNM